MKTDRELLELAAKAAEYDYWPDGYDDELTEPCIMDGQFPTPWNPLTDDGDALRLAVSLDLHVQCDFREDGLVIIFGGWFGRAIEEPAGSDKYAATRRAIVRAAAAIGEDME